MQKKWNESNPESLAVSQKKYANSAKGKAYRKAWIESRPGYMQRMGRAHHLRSKYGITAVDYDRMMAEQGGVCAICSRPETARHNGKVKALSVDHCHSTGKVRGLLCYCCNVSLGKMGEDPGRMRSAAMYVESGGHGG